MSNLQIFYISLSFQVENRQLLRSTCITFDRDEYLLQRHILYTRDSQKFINQSGFDTADIITNTRGEIIQIELSFCLDSRIFITAHHMNGTRIQSHILILDCKGRVNVLDLNGVGKNRLYFYFSGEIFDWQLQLMSFYSGDFSFCFVFHSSLLSRSDILTGFCCGQSLHPFHQRSQVYTFRDYIQIRRLRVGKINLTIDGNGILGFLCGSKTHIDCIEVDLRVSGNHVQVIICFQNKISDSDRTQANRQIFHTDITSNNDFLSRYRQIIGNLYGTISLNTLSINFIQSQLRVQSDLSTTVLDIQIHCTGNNTRGISITQDISPSGKIQVQFDME